MRLYLFEHCSICFRVRMAAALKHLHLQETVVLEDDSATMIGLVGKRVVPILVKNDGRPMLESMDMVAHIEQLGDPVLTGPQRGEVGAWADGVASKTVPLTAVGLSIRRSSVSRSGIKASICSRVLARSSMKSPSVLRLRTM